MTVTFINLPHGYGRVDKEPASVSADVSLTEKPAMPNGMSTTRRNDLAPEFKVETVQLDILVSAKHPVRKQTKKQISRAIRSIERFGFRVPPILGKNREIIDGHIRVEAARQLGIKEIPCIIADDLSENDIRLLRMTVNRIQERGEWDEQALKLEFASMLEFEHDLTVTGFENAEIDRILLLDDPGSDGADPLDKLDAMPDPGAAAVTRPGDLWLAGNHRVFCGNARSADDLHSVVGETQISAVFTDPPYNVVVNGHIRVGKSKFAEFAEASGEMSDQEYEDFLRITTENIAKALKPGGVLFLCIDWRHAEVLMRVLRNLGLELINVCVWGKDKPGMGSLYRSQHEFVLVAKRTGAPHLNNVQLGSHGRSRSNLWRYAGATGGRTTDEDDFSLHPTVKPVHLVRDAILDVTAIGDVVLDPFLGSGTTLLAAELGHRVCVGVELSPAYVDVSVRRWEKMTGLEVIHAETKQTFSETAVERGANRHPGPSPQGDDVAKCHGPDLEADF